MGPAVARLRGARFLNRRAGLWTGALPVPFVNGWPVASGFAFELTVVQEDTSSVPINRKPESRHQPGSLRFTPLRGAGPDTPGPALFLTGTLTRL